MVLLPASCSRTQTSVQSGFTCRGHKHHWYYWQEGMVSRCTQCAILFPSRSLCKDSAETLYCLVGILLSQINCYSMQTRLLHSRTLMKFVPSTLFVQLGISTIGSVWLAAIKTEYGHQLKYKHLARKEDFCRDVDPTKWNVQVPNPSLSGLTWN